ncbi:hypothetical protein QNI16_36575 [Cytophagaceae bacterium YF14B1]|uniref:Uncharacterized protein n=1 Tax=Xanthocytophaga flava TaxID=3048013 RepID=A0AAE3QZM5_9BACT|nr:hypothetical protein [Xanthocytophaga flavus]MDJ1486055.1 hypothetical protein [Xanthocytophaga flavus]
MKSKSWFLGIYLSLVSLCSYAQTSGAKQIPASETKNNTDIQAEQLLDKALEPLSESPAGMAIYFKKVALGIPDPKQIHAIAQAEAYEGGYFITSENRFEYKLADLKGLSDGKIAVVIDEFHKMMVIDSIRDKSPLDGSPLDFASLEEEHIGKKALTYMGEEAIQGKKYHKIQLEFKKKEDMLVYYWIETASGKLTFIAEKQSDVYNVFWIDKVTPTPKNQKFEVFLPKHELTSFYGFQVQDLRFTNAYRAAN